MPDELISVPFVNDGKKFEIPIIKVSDVRVLQKVRAGTKETEAKELESSIALVKSILTKIDKNVTQEQIIDWDYAEFISFVKKLWEKNAANFRGVLPNLPAMK